MLSENALSIIEQGNALLPARQGDSSFTLEEKAAKLLLMMVKLASERRRLEHKLSKASSVEKAIFAKQLFSATVKTVQEKHAQAESSTEFTEAKEETNNLKADITYVSTCIDIYKNAHLLFRQKLRQEQDDVV